MGTARETKPAGWLAQPPARITNPVIERVEARVILDPYLSLVGLAGYSGLSVRKLRAHLADVMHPLPCYRVGGKILVRRSEFDTVSLLYDLYRRGLVAVASVGEERRLDPVGAIKDLLSLAQQRMQEKRYDAAITAYEEVLALDRLNQNAKKGLLAATEARNRSRAVRSVPREKIPVLAVDLKTLTRENFDPQEGFVLSRVNGEWDVQSILKLCPMAEDDALLIFSRLLERGIIELR